MLVILISTGLFIFASFLNVQFQIGGCARLVGRREPQVGEASFSFPHKPSSLGRQFEELYAEKRCGCPWQQAIY
jgi:hypothetical protein